MSCSTGGKKHNASRQRAAEGSGRIPIAWDGQSWERGECPAEAQQWWEVEIHGYDHSDSKAIFIFIISSSGGGGGGGKSRRENLMCSLVCIYFVSILLKGRE